MKKGLNIIGINHIGLNNTVEFVFAIMGSPLVWLGIFCYLVSLFIWMLVLSRIDLSIAYPASSACYIFVPLLSVFFLQEKVGPIRWLGIFLIVAGIHFISQSKPKEQKA